MHSKLAEADQSLETSRWSLHPPQNTKACQLGKHLRRPHPLALHPQEHPQVADQGRHLEPDLDMHEHDRLLFDDRKLESLSCYSISAILPSKSVPRQSKKHHHKLLASSEPSPLNRNHEYPKLSTGSHRAQTH